MKGVLKVVSALRMVIKYAGLILCIVDIIGYAANKIEEYATKKDTPSIKNDQPDIQ